MPQVENNRIFAGTVLVYGCSIYVDTSTGQGVGEVLKRMAGFLNRFGGWYTGDGALAPEDLRQEAYAATLEGLRAYDPSRKAQLSTFLQRHVRNRMLDVCRRARCLERLEQEPAETDFDPENRIDLQRALTRWEERWQRIIFGIVIEGRSMAETAETEDMTPWGLSRAIKRRLVAALEEMS